MLQPIPLLLAFLLSYLSNNVPASASSEYHDYCVIGAGPGGLQIGYFLQKAGRDYVIFERSNRTGNFFYTYPRHRKLISINKRFTGQLNAEFNMRHDWNSLLSDDDELLMTKYSKEMFPHTDVLLKYLNDYQRKLHINVQFETNVNNIRTVPNATAPDGHSFVMEDQNGNDYTCRTMIVATGISTPNIPVMQGMEHVTGYESMSLDPEDYEGKSVLILGRGNSAFEIADGIYGSTNSIHMVARSRIRLAWATHYVGDLRAVNNGLLDTYQLKSLDGILEGSLTGMSIIKKGDKLYYSFGGYQDAEFSDNSALREPYDIIIRALGFTFDATIFNNTAIKRGKSRAKKYPAISHKYESADNQGLFYAGTVAHSLDFRKSAGGFIHGFRYTARALHRLLEWRYEKTEWPSTSFPKNQLLSTILKRINEASGTYQMFQVLGDIAIFDKDRQTVRYLEEFPINLLHELSNCTGIDVGSVLVIVMEYGQDFSGPGKDTFRSDRAIGDPSEAHLSNFLHPVLYFYESLPTNETMKSRQTGETLPRPNKLHHVVEDFLTLWDGQQSHVLPLRRFLEGVMEEDLRSFFSESCFQLAMAYSTVPESCKSLYLKGKGLEGSASLLTSAKNTGMMQVL